MDGAKEYYAKRNKSVRGRQIPYGFTLVEFKKQNKQAKGKKRERERGKLRNRLLIIESKLVVTRGEGGLRSTQAVMSPG